MTPPTEEGDKLTAAMELRRLEAWLKAVPLSDLSLLPLTEDEAAELHVAFSAMWNGVDFMRKGGVDTPESRVARYSTYSAIARAVGWSRPQNMNSLARRKRRFWNAGLRLWWHRLWIREDEFHPSLDSDPLALSVMTPGERRAYLRDLYQRRAIAHKRRMFRGGCSVTVPKLDPARAPKCPRCGYPQFCGCNDFCRSQIPVGFLPYTWVPQDSRRCAGCGLVLHADQWLDIEVAAMRQRR